MITWTKPFKEVWIMRMWLKYIQPQIDNGTAHFCIANHADLQYNPMIWTAWCAVQFCSITVCLLPTTRWVQIEDPLLLYYRLTALTQQTDLCADWKEGKSLHSNPSDTDFLAKTRQFQAGREFPFVPYHQACNSFMLCESLFFTGWCSNES